MNSLIDPAWLAAHTVKVYPERLRAMHRMYGIKSGLKCKTCKHLKRYRYGKTYLKCDLNRQTHGTATDWKANFEACGKHELRNSSEGANK